MGFACLPRPPLLPPAVKVPSTCTPRRLFSSSSNRRLRCLRAFAMASMNHEAEDQRVPRIASAIRVIPDFPKPGVIFHDITTLLLQPEAFRDTIDIFVERYRDRRISIVAGIEARGFIFGSPVALAIGAKFVPIRKPKKLPGEVISEEYSLEYGTDRVEMHVGAARAGDRAVVIDDLIATGGTLCAATQLLERVGAEVVECACVIELPELKGSIVPPDAMRAKALAFIVLVVGRDRLGEKPLCALVKAA